MCACAGRYHGMPVPEISQLLDLEMAVLVGLLPLCTATQHSVHLHFVRGPASIVALK
jgi:hypothetical protein